MDSRTRVTRLIRHETVDRMPLYGWVSLNMRDKIESAFGTVEAFEDHYEFDLAHLFGGPLTFRQEEIDALRDSGRSIEPSDILDAGMTDPDDTDSYSGLIEQIEHHRARGRFLYVQTPGILEQYNDYIELAE